MAGAAQDLVLGVGAVEPAVGHRDPLEVLLEGLEVAWGQVLELHVVTESGELAPPLGRGRADTGRLVGLRQVERKRLLKIHGALAGGSYDRSGTSPWAGSGRRIGCWRCRRGPAWPSPRPGWRRFPRDELPGPSSIRARRRPPDLEAWRSAPPGRRCA